MTKEYDVVVAGYICVDLIPGFNREKPACSSLTQLLEPGKLIEIDGLGFTLGGAVATTGLLLEKFSRNVFLNGMIGDDLMGRMVKDNLERYQLFEGIRTTREKGTAFSIVLAFPGTDRIFLESPGCSELFNINHIHFDAIAKSRLFHFGYPPLLKQFYRNNGNQLVALFSRIQQMGVVTAMDFSLPDADSESGKLDWPEMMRRVLPHTDIFMPSLEEALLIMMPQRYKEIRKALDKDEMIDHISLDIIRDVGRKIIDSGVKMVLIKAGHRGIYLLTANISSINERSGLHLPEERWNDNELWCEAYPADPCKIVNASGAGDTAVAAFLSAIMDSAGPETALRYAAMAGRNSLYCHDIAKELLGWDAMTNELQHEWTEIKSMNN